jgi:hypothetical protein
VRLVLKAYPVKLVPKDYKEMPAPQEQTACKDRKGCKAKSDPRACKDLRASKARKEKRAIKETKEKSDRKDPQLPWTSMFCPKILSAPRFLKNGRCTQLPTQTATEKLLPFAFKVLQKCFELRCRRSTSSQQ